MLGQCIKKLVFLEKHSLSSLAGIEGLAHGVTYPGEITPALAKLVSSAQVWFFSNTVTWWPRKANSKAVVTPMIPAPMTAMRLCVMADGPKTGRALWVAGKSDERGMEGGGGRDGSRRSRCVAAFRGVRWGGDGEEVELQWVGSCMGL